MKFPDLIEQADRNLFFNINSKWINSLFDVMMPFIRERNNWIPLYIILAILFIYQYKRNALIIITMTALTVLLSDQLSSSVIKPLVNRDRPCQIDSPVTQVRLLVGCGLSKSFTSSHAANHFGMAMIFTLLFSRKYKWVTWMGFLWAGLIAYAQVYVGVHFPLDVIGGAIAGILSAILIYIISKKWVLYRWNWQP